MSWSEALEAARRVALRAGALLRAEMARPGGPRGDARKAPADAEVELLVHEALTEACPGFGFRGEERPELSRPPARPGGPLWLIDPNDGTSAFHRGCRGASVSIGLVHQGRPVLGVIYAYAWPDDRGTLYSWAEGEAHISVDGVPRPRGSWPTQLGADDIVLMSHYADRAPLVNAAVTHPARLHPVPGIAHRLASAAAGMGAMAISLFGAKDYDCAAGHALIRGAGGEVVDDHGEPLRYYDAEVTRYGACYGGGLALAKQLSRRDLSEVLDGIPGEEAPADLVRPSPEARVAGDLLDRGHGLMLGWLLSVSDPASGALGAAGRLGIALGRALVRTAADQRAGVISTILGDPSEASEVWPLLALVSGGERWLPDHLRSALTPRLEALRQAMWAPLSEGRAVGEREDPWAAAADGARMGGRQFPWRLVAPVLTHRPQRPEHQGPASAHWAVDAPVIAECLMSLR